MNGFDLLVINDDIKRAMLSRVREATKKQQSQRLFLVINTLGGLPGIAYRIMKLLDTKYKTINVLVPDVAMSAGTLMCFGGNRIYMFAYSSLGPLDLQIEHPTDGSRISTLDVRDTMDTVLSHVIVAAEQLFKQSYVEFDLGKDVASKVAFDASTRLVQPIVDKIDPYHLHRSFRNGEVGAIYASNLLKTRMMKDKPELADAVGRYLNNNYSTHNYSITLDEARNKLFLTIDNLEDLKEWSMIEPLVDLSTSGVYYETIDIKPEERKGQEEAAEASAKQLVKKGRK